jgi:phosphoglucomutase
MSLEQQAKQRAEAWTKAPYDEETQKIAREIIEQGGDDLINAFYQDLDFGTGGLRGIMGVGTNRVNRYTLGLATQGLANYLASQLPGKQHKVAIAFDSRNNSKKFSTEIADVLAANGIIVHLFEDLRPTPELSFAIRHLNCDAGIVITASHNPPEYNGYKVYWNDGGQLVPPHDNGVIDEVRKVNPEEVKYGGDQSLIKIEGEKLDKAYLDELVKQCLTNDGKEDLRVVFTSIHGTSITAMPQALEAAGFTDVHIVEEQATPDGNFPTVKSPNPEEAAALDMALKLATEKEADMVIGTDPDSDRVGIAVRNSEGELELLNGNQAASVLIYYCLERWKEAGRLTGDQFVAKTIVTTDLIDRMAEAYHVDCPNVLTGFKWIADVIRKYEGQKKFIVGGEESYGYMVGDFVRDKDAIASGVLLAEAAAWAKAKGSSFFELLIEVYQKFGFYLESLVSLKKEGHKGAEEIRQMMEDFRHKTPKSIAGESLVEMRDYQSSEIINLQTGERTSLDIPKSNVVQFFTDKGTKITARPSGTEPKIKFYISVNRKLADRNLYPEVRRALESQITDIKKGLGL